jgi:ABC-type Na+ efflux pump permease subunit
MSSGTEAISGQKERGTFSRILLTPVSRKDLVRAFTNGVFISSLIPSVVVIIITLLIPAYRHLSGFIPMILLVASLALFISALTVMISVMNDTVT